MRNASRKQNISPNLLRNLPVNKPAEQVSPCCFEHVAHPRQGRQVSNLSWHAAVSADYPKKRVAEPKPKDAIGPYE